MERIDLPDTAITEYYDRISLSWEIDSGRLFGEWKLVIEDLYERSAGKVTAWQVLLRGSSGNIRTDGEVVRLSGLRNGIPYSCRVRTVYKNHGASAFFKDLILTPATTAPGAPTITSADYGDGKIILTVSVSDNGGKEITGYEATCTDGTNTYTGTSTSSPITVSGLTNDVAYTCTVKATNSVGTSSASAMTDPITPEATATGLPIWLLYQATQ